MILNYNRGIPCYSSAVLVCKRRAGEFTDIFGLNFQDIGGFYMLILEFNGIFILEKALGGFSKLFWYLLSTQGLETKS